MQYDYSGIYLIHLIIIIIECAFCWSTLVLPILLFSNLRKRWDIKWKVKWKIKSVRVKLLASGIIIIIIIIELVSLLITPLFSSLSLSLLIYSLTLNFFPFFFSLFPVDPHVQSKPSKLIFSPFPIKSLQSNFSLFLKNPEIPIVQFFNWLSLEKLPPWPSPPTRLTWA